MDNNGFEQYQKLFEYKFDELGKKLDKLYDVFNEHCDSADKRMDKMSTDLTTLKVRSSVYGALSGLATGGFTAIAQFLKGGK